MLVVCGGCGHVPLDYPRTASFAVRCVGRTDLGRAVAPAGGGAPGGVGAAAAANGAGRDGARVAMVEMAQKSLDLQYFMWEDDLVGDLLLDCVLKAADRGVRVRLLLDDFYQLGRDKRWAAVDSHPNIEVRMFNPLGGSRTSKFSRSMNYGLGPSRNRGRMHNKALVVDGAGVVVGGRNIADEYFAASEEYNFADQDLLAIGPAAREAADVFDQYWNSPVAIPVEAFAKGDSKMLDAVRGGARRIRRRGTRSTRRVCGTRTWWTRSGIIRCRGSGRRRRSWRTIRASRCWTSRTSRGRSWRRGWRRRWSRRGTRC